MPKSEPFVIHPQLMQYGRMQIVHLHRILNRILANFVCGAVNVAWLESAAGKPNAETITVVTSTVLTFPRWCPPEFGRP